MDHRENLMRKMEVRLFWKRKYLGRGDVGAKMNNSQSVWISERDQMKGYSGRQGSDLHRWG